MVGSGGDKRTGRKMAEADKMKETVLGAQIDVERNRRQRVNGRIPRPAPGFSGDITTPDDVRRR